MPLSRCGSVSARFSVWFSRVSASPNSLTRRGQDFEAAGIVRRELLLRRAPGTAMRGASIPLRSGSAIRFESRKRQDRLCRESLDASGLCAFVAHLKRPAIIRWMTRNRSPSSSQTSRLPSRRSARTFLPLALIDRRIERADEKRTGDANPIEPLPDDARLAAHAGRARYQEVQARSSYWALRIECPACWP